VRPCWLLNRLQQSYLLLIYLFICLFIIRDVFYLPIAGIERYCSASSHTYTLGRTLLDEWSARHRDLYLTTLNTHKWQTSMLPAGFEPAIPANERPQTHVVERAATGISCYFCGISRHLDIIRVRRFLWIARLETGNKPPCLFH